MKQAIVSPNACTRSLGELLLHFIILIIKSAQVDVTEKIISGEKASLISLLGMT